MKKAKVLGISCLHSHVLVAIVCLSLGLPACGSHSTTAGQEESTILSYAPDGKGYLKRIAENKTLLHVEGSPYEMGYQHGYLLGKGVARMASTDFYIAVLAGLIGESEEVLRDTLSEEFKEFAVDLFHSLCAAHEQDIPQEYIEEMHGIAEGAAAAGYSVGYENILMNNMAFDVLLSIGYPIITPFLPYSDSLSPHACDGFVAYDNATADGSVLMGRSWMFTGSITHEESLLIEYEPDNGNRFITPSLPAWVGVVVAMNSSGIGIGMDMVPAMDCSFKDIGMGVILLARTVVQYARELSEAVDIIQRARMGVSWIIAIGDGRGDEIGGAVIELSAHAVKVRTCDYEYPRCMSTLCPPDQVEDKDDLIVFANHYIVPWMSLTRGTYAVKDSLLRYHVLTGLLMNAYGAIDIEKGRGLVNYLHQYNGEADDEPVWASRTLFDLTHLELWSLYGHFNDPWVHYAY